MKEKIVGLRELRENTKKYIDRVNKGESFLVLKRSKPIFKISSPEEIESLWETVVDFTENGKKDGIEAEKLLEILNNG
ncbi:MAG: type II toxin-antitoxin system prevent-host-death family antitoxin [Candidatus Paceibacterota bacterium]